MKLLLHRREKKTKNETQFIFSTKKETKEMKKKLIGKKNEKDILRNKES